MNKILKYALISLSLLVFLFGFFLVYVFFAVNPNDFKPQIAKYVQENKHRNLDISGDIKLTLFPRIGLDLGKVSLSEVDGKGEFASLKSAKLFVAWMPLLQKSLVVDRITLTGATISLVRDKDGKNNYDDLIKSEGGGGSGTFDIQGVEISDSALSYEDKSSGKKISLSNFSLDTGRLKDGLHTNIDAAFDLAASGVRTHIQGKSGLMFDLAGKHYVLDGLDIGVKGEAMGISDIDFSLKGSADATGDSVQCKGLDIAASGKKDGKPRSIKLTVDIRADMAKQDIEADVDTKLDESHIKAKLGFAGFAKPDYRFDINIDRINADNYLEKAGKGPEKPMDLSFIRDLNAKGKVKIGFLQISNLKTDNLSVDVNAANDRLSLAPISASLYQGTLAGSLGATSSGSFSLKPQLKGVSIGPLLKDFMDKDMLEGRGSVSMDLDASGLTVSALKRALNGSAEIRLIDGAVKGVNIAAMLRKAKGGGATASANSAEKTDFAELSASFRVRNGVAHNEDLSMKSPLLRLTGNGDIDIGQSRMNYLAKVSVVGTLEGQGGAELAALKGVTVPVRLSGPLDSLSYSVDVGALAAATAKGKLEQKKEEVKTQLKEQLKGFLGR